MMKQSVKNAIYVISDEVIVREVEGHVMVIPLKGGIGDLEDELFTLNKTAYSIWKNIDGERNIWQIKRELTKEYDACSNVIEKDVLGLVKELAKRNIVIKK